MLLAIHIVAGGLAIILGAVALSVMKGGTIHRRSGMLFVYAMVVMGITASILGNLGGGLMTGYFVGTALTTVRPLSAWTRTFHVAALTVVVGLALLTFVGGVKAFSSPGGFLDGVPFVMHFFLATVMILAAAGDVRIMRFGVPRGGPRLARRRESRRGVGPDAAQGPARAARCGAVRAGPSLGGRESARDSPREATRQ